jgi:HSP20 family protein
MTTLLKRRRATAPSLARSFFPDLFDIDSLLDLDFPGFATLSNMPMVNIREEKEKYTLELAAPGMKKSDFEIEMDNHLLTISYEKEQETKEQDNKYTRREYNYSSFSRSFHLPEWVDEKKISAVYDNGILTVSVPKLPSYEKDKTTHIPIT